MSGEFPEESKQVPRTVLWLLASLSVILCFLLTANLIRSHLKHFTRPMEQRKMIGIMWLAPIFATDALLSLTVPDLSPVLELLKKSYEAYALYLFFALMVEFLGGDERTVELLQAKIDPIYHARPFRWFRPCSNPMIDLNDNGGVSAGKFFWACKRGIMQFVILRPLMAFVAAVLWLFGKFHNGVIDWEDGYLYIEFIVNISMMYAIYSLVNFYYALKKPLEPHNPLPKFMAIKAVIFLCFWQSVLLAVLAQFHVLNEIGSYSVEDVKTGLNDLLVCFEMCGIAIFHHYAFPWEEYDRGGDYTLPNTTGLANSVGFEFGLAESGEDFHHVVLPSSSSPSNVENTGARPLLRE